MLCSQTCTGVVEKAQSGDYEDTTRLFDEAQALIYELGQNQRSKSFTDLPTALKAVVEKVQKAFETKSSVTGINTGFVDLNRMTAGLQGGDLLILAARPAMGKTAFALGMASHAAMHAGKSVLYCSLEMGHLELTQRLLAAEAQEALRRGTQPALDHGSPVVRQTYADRAPGFVRIPGYVGVPFAGCRLEAVERRRQEVEQGRLSGFVRTDHGDEVSEGLGLESGESPEAVDPELVP